MEDDYLQHVAEMDTASLRNLMETYGQHVWEYAFVLTKDYHLADDVVQDVFINAYRKIHTFRGESSIKTWLLAITRNVSINHKRSAFFRKVTLIGFIHDKGQSTSAENDYFDQTLTDEIWELILRLPRHFREILVMDAKYQLSTKEIANILSLPEGTVKSRLHRARKAVSSSFKEVNEYEPV